jgi:RecJ-like exonuclease
MRCNECAKWILAEKTLYGDGTEIFNFRAPEGKGACRVLNIDTDPTFGCHAFKQKSPQFTHVIVRDRKPGMPHQYSYAGPCPDCRGAGNAGGGACYRCAGTGKVRHYDDGYIGEERTRLHPKEKELGLLPEVACPKCAMKVEVDWMVCPKCATKLNGVAETEKVDLDFIVETTAEGE